MHAGAISPMCAEAHQERGMRLAAAGNYEATRSRCGSSACSVILRGFSGAHQEPPNGKTHMEPRERHPENFESTVQTISLLRPAYAA